MRLDLKRHLTVIAHRGRLLLEFVERINAVLRLVRTRLWLTAHPVELGAQQVARTCSLCRKVLQALFAFLQEIAVVALVAVHALVINLNNLVAHIVKEITVMGHHQQAAAHARQILLEPLHHLKVKVVGRLVKDHQLRLLNKHCRQCNALLLTARKFLYRLVEILYFQLREHLLRAVLIVPRLQAVHLLHQVLQLRMVVSLNGSLILRNHLGLLSIALQARLDYRELTVKIRLLLKVAHAYVVAQGNPATLIRLLARNNLQQRTLSLAVAGNESNALSLLHGERYVIEKHQVTETL